MQTAPRALALTLAGSLLAVAAAPGDAAPHAVAVALNVRFIPTSLACAATAAQSGFEVVCGLPVLISGTGAYGTGGRSSGWSAAGSAADGQPVAETGGTPAQGEVVRWLARSGEKRGRMAAEITGWRLVSSENSSYVELTIAW